MTEARKGQRVVDRRHPDIVGTVWDDSDPITKLVRVKWDRGQSSLVFLGILDLASETAE